MNGQPTRPVQWFLSLAPIWQGLVVLSAAVLMGTLLSGYVGLPGRVATVEAQMREANADLDLVLRIGCTTVRQVDPINEPAECANIFRNAGSLP